jgi:hypothetical protein
MKFFFGVISGVVGALLMVFLIISRSQIIWWSVLEQRPNIVSSQFGAYSSEVRYNFGGSPAYIQFMFENKLSGPSISFHNNGTISSIGNNLDGEKTGRWQTFLPDGTAGYTAEFSGGKVVSGRWYTPP